MSENDRTYGGGRIDSFFIETRVHGCDNIMCPHNMAGVLAGDRGKHCRYKKIRINQHGICKDYGDAQREAMGISEKKEAQA